MNDLDPTAPDVPTRTGGIIIIDSDDPSYVPPATGKGSHTNSFPGDYDDPDIAPVFNPESGGGFGYDDNFYDTRFDHNYDAVTISTRDGDTTYVGGLTVTAQRPNGQVPIASWIPGNTAFDQTPSLPGAIQEIVVTGNRYLMDCNDEATANYDLRTGIAAHIHDPGRLANDTLNAIGALTYLQDEVVPDAPYGLVLQDKIKIDENGLFGVVYQRTGTNEFVFAFEGTHEPEAVKIDAAIILKAKYSEGLDQFRSFMDRVSTNILQFDPAAKFDLTGHSLGGTLALLGAGVIASKGVSGENIKVSAMAPVAADNAFIVAGINQNFSAIVTSWIREADPFRDIVSDNYGTIKYTFRTDTDPYYYNPDGSIVINVDMQHGHDVCAYIKATTNE